MPTMPSSRSLDDPTSRTLISALEAVGAGRSTVILPEPEAQFRADLRTQLVAVTPRLVAEGPRGEVDVPARHGLRTVAAAPARRPFRRRRAMTVLVAGIAVVVLGLGGATWLARNALPGDPLYGLKRTAEGVDVSLAGSDVDKGTALLLDATTRVQEVDALLAQPQSMASGSGPTAGGALTAETIELVVSTLQDADTNTRKGVSTIGDDAIERADGAGLQVVVSWADGQKKSIAALVNRIPDSATQAKAQAQTSYQQISAAYTRASDLLSDVTRGVTCQRQRDDLGPKPCDASLTPTVPAPSPSVSSPPLSSPTGSGSASAVPTGGAGTSSGAPTPGGTTPSTTPSVGPPTSDTPSATASVTPGVAAPVIEPPVLSAPVSIPVVVVNSCGVEVSLPVGGVTISICPPGG